MTEDPPFRPAGAVTVRLAETRDSRDAVRLLDQLGYTPDPDGVAADIQTGAAGVVYVAVSDGRVVGLLALSVHRQFHWGAPVASVDALVVDATIRSHGVGAMLLDTAVAHARQQRCILVELHSNRRRRRARRFYERYGFEVTSAYFVKPVR
jgi:GNAT superfamily N-acetyltransferase